MKKTTSKQAPTEMRAEYNFAAGVRGKYVDRYRRGTNIVLLDPEVAQAFPDSKSVNDALRAILAIATRTNTRKPHEHASHDGPPSHRRKRDVLD